MDTHYKGFDIRFNEGAECWNAWKSGEEVFTDKSFKMLKEKIDNFFKVKVPRLKFYDESNGIFDIWEVTSFGDSNAWASKGRSRQKLYSSHDLIFVNLENDVLIEEITRLTKEYHRLEKIIDEKKQKLKSITVSDYINQVSSEGGLKNV